MYVGEIFRYSRPYSSNPSTIDGLPNYFHFTDSPGANMALLDSGINRTSKVSSTSGSRRPAILISSSPHKIGTKETPWQDFFDPDNGHIRYYGDNKALGKDPATASGNRALLEQFELQTSPDRNQRIKASPILFFIRVRMGKRAKGNVKFQGYGIIKKAERITQYNQKTKTPFSNYAFDFVVFSLTNENELFNWDWISDRRDNTLDDKATLRHAPLAWKKWVNEGSKSIENNRRRVSKLQIYKKSQQICTRGSREEKILDEIYSYYTDKKNKDRFESLASIVASQVIQQSGTSYTEGWITPKSSDHGVDFIGRLDLGTDLAKTKIIILGQAKCEDLDTVTNGMHIARTVSRLMRGYIGVYVTTSHFSDRCQREVIEGKFPIILINGQRVAKEVMALMHSNGYSSVTNYLDYVDSLHEQKIMQRDPEEILSM